MAERPHKGPEQELYMHRKQHTLTVTALHREEGENSGLLREPLLRRKGGNGQRVGVTR